MRILKFPTRLKIKTENPIIDFYSKCLKSLGKSTNIKGLDVTKFTVNPKDYKKLSTFTFQHFKNTYPFLTKKRIKTEVSFFLLQFGPCEKETVPEGSVLVDLKNLYVRNE